MTTTEGLDVACGLVLGGDEVPAQLTKTDSIATRTGDTLRIRTDEILE